MHGISFSILINGNSLKKGLIFSCPHKNDFIGHFLNNEPALLPLSFIAENKAKDLTSGVNKIQSLNSQIDHFQGKDLRTRLALVD